MRTVLEGLKVDLLGKAGEHGEEQRPFCTAVRVDLYSRRRDRGHRKADPIIVLGKRLSDSGGALIGDQVFLKGLDGLPLDKAEVLVKVDGQLPDVSQVDAAASNNGSRARTIGIDKLEDDSSLGEEGGVHELAVVAVLKVDVEGPHLWSELGGYLLVKRILLVADF